MKIRRFNEELFNNNEPKKGEYIIFQIATAKIYLIEVISHPKRYIPFNDTDFQNSISVEVYQYYGMSISKFFYDYEDDYFWWIDGSKVNIRWRGYDKLKAIKKFKFLKNLENYNI